MKIMLTVHSLEQTCINSVTVWVTKAIKRLALPSEQIVIDDSFKIELLLIG